jgi:hypothetical protein
MPWRLNVRHWLERAEEARALPGQMNDLEAKRGRGSGLRTATRSWPSLPRTSCSRPRSQLGGYRGIHLARLSVRMPTAGGGLHRPLPGWQRELGYRCRYRAGQGFAAIAAVEHHAAEFHLRHAERVPLGTS